MDQISKYFNAEKNESLLFIAVGLIAIFLSIYFLVFIKHPFYNGISYALIALALIQLTVGFSIYFRSPKDIIRVNRIVQNEKQKISTEEIPRMITVMKNFVIYRWVEIALILVGMFMYYKCSTTTIWSGLGLGLFIQADLMLILDYFAESRGKKYLKYLQDLK